MIPESIAYAALVMIHLGFAALLGAFARQAKPLGERVAVFLTALAFFGSGLSLPVPLVAKVTVTLISAVVSTYFGRQVKTSQWQARLAWIYAGFAMLLILGWSAAQGWFSPLVSLAAAAAVAAVLAWKRGLSSAS
jgi:hypothetical protein